MERGAKARAMASKKSREEEWWQCGVCERVLHRGDLEGHTSGCETTPTFVQHGVLRARVIRAPSTALTES
ncbi:hypothetical protein ACOMHN_059577 [Nucella lapillus]